MNYRYLGELRNCLSYDYDSKCIYVNTEDQIYSLVDGLNRRWVHNERISLIRCFDDLLLFQLDTKEEIKIVRSLDGILVKIIKGTFYLNRSLVLGSNLFIETNDTVVKINLENLEITVLPVDHTTQCICKDGWVDRQKNNIWLSDLETGKLLWEIDIDAELKKELD